MATAPGDRRAPLAPAIAARLEGVDGATLVFLAEVVRQLVSETDIAEAKEDALHAAARASSAKAATHGGDDAKARGAKASRDSDSDDDDDRAAAAADAKPTRAIVPTTEARAAATWDEGVDVEARFQGGNRFYPATIERARADGLYDLVYDGGMREAGVPAALIRREGAWR